MNAKRILAVTLRQAYLYKRSFPRLLEIFYWPTLDLILWGFVTLYLERSTTGLPRSVSFFLGALILWDVLFRAQQGVSVSFLEDMWSRNLVNIFVSPLRISEYIVGLILLSILKVIVAFFVMSALAGLFYSFSIFKLGITLIPLILNLVAMGWAIGILTIGLILRFGQETEVLAWALAFLLMPFSAVFYPVEVLPPFLQKVALFIPSAHVFEGMRSIINDTGFPIVHILWASFLNFFLILSAIGFFVAIYRITLRRGIIPKIGE